MKKQNEVKKDLKCTVEEFSKYDINSEFDLLADEAKKEETNELLIQEKHLADLLLSIKEVDFVAEKNPKILQLRAEHEKLAKKVLDKKGNPKDANSDDYIKYQSIDKQISSIKIRVREYSVLVIKIFKKIVIDNNYDLKVFEKEIVFYNGKYWQKITEESFSSFLSEVARKMGLKSLMYEHHTFGNDLIKQFIHSNFRQHAVKTNVTAINLQNGTYKFINGVGKLFPHNKNDNLNYILSFEYDESVTCPIFLNYLEHCLPEEDKRMVIQEFFGYVFTPNEVLNLEKCLLMYGSGSNGKSVLNNVMERIYGKINISSFSISKLTCKQRGEYYLASIQGKLLNYCSDTNGAIDDSGVFKQLISGERVSARHPSGRPFDYLNNCKFIFNVNSLPSSSDASNGYFRRFLIIHFNVVIEDRFKDGNLALKIIKNELSGVFNWILLGLNRLLKNGFLSECNSSIIAAENFRKKSDNVFDFLCEEQYEVVDNVELGVIFSELYEDYLRYLAINGGIPCRKVNFRERLNGLKLGGKEVHRNEKCNGNKHRVNIKRII
ncbi:DNA primase family protein [Flavobacterium aquatile]|uniref:DNA primase family protein n=1 Tax=Flavobacterium aquatile TaxID=245 RepID=UPI00068B4339|nr:DNA primase family protein [Flavobacterium aquatile]OXA65478.1 hypothetical protein B0A61_14860 [Flavobacterium aquatile LMG 4008 = ATCC 11947]GEC80201.1 hypothetical protein FAQ01_30710 [Flavobacterium aquatile]